MSRYGCFKTKKSESVAMATAPADDSTNQEPAEAEECPGKKKSKFQTFKQFFSRKRRKAPPGGDDLKTSISSDNLSQTRESQERRADSDKTNRAEAGLGSRAQSHDSVFASDWSEAQEGLGASQDSLQGKVKNLQMQLKQAMRLGPNPLLCVKRTEDNGVVSEDDGLPCSPPEYTPNKSQPLRSSSISLDSTEEQGWCSSAAGSPLVAAPGDFSSPASASVCLDTSAARHKLALRTRAQHRRRPATRLKLESTNPSPDQSTTEHTGEEEEMKDEDVEVKAKLNGAEEESPAKPCEPNPDQDLDSEEEQDSSRCSPEPTAEDTEDLPDSVGLSESSLEEKLGEDSSEEEEGDREEEGETEGESSLLLEVLSSLKTPLNAITERHQGEPERAEPEQTLEETREAAVHKRTPEDHQNDAPKDENQEVEPQQQDTEPEDQEVQADAQEGGVSFYKDADDEVISSKEESEEEPEVEHFNEPNPKNVNEDFQEHGNQTTSLTNVLDGNDNQNFIQEQILEQNLNDVNKHLHNIEQEDSESEEEETQVTILEQEKKQQESGDCNFEDESDINYMTEPEMEMQNPVEVVKFGENFHVQQDLTLEETEICDQNDSEIVDLEFELEPTAKMVPEDEKEESLEEHRDAQDGQERDIKVCDVSQGQTPIETLEMNLVSPNAEKHVQFVDGFKEVLKSDQIITVQEPTMEIEDALELDNLEKMENEVEFLDKMQDESVTFLPGETDENQKEDTLEKMEKDIFHITEGERIISERETPEEEHFGTFEKYIDKKEETEDLAAIEVSLVEAEIQKSRDLKEIGFEAHEKETNLLLKESQIVMNNESKEEYSEKSKADPSRAKFTIAAAWQRPRSFEAENVQEVSFEPRPDPESQAVQESGNETHNVQEIKPESRPETNKVQESRAVTHKVEESGPGPEPQSGSETHIVQESKPESRLETPKDQESRVVTRKVEESGPGPEPQSGSEAHKLQESKPEPRPETNKVQVPRFETHKFKESRPETRPETPKVQESRVVTHKVEESSSDPEPQSGFETHIVQESKPESRPETNKVQVSRLETHKFKESRSEFRHETPKVQESRVVTHKVQDSSPDPEPQSGSEAHKVQESKPESRPESNKVQVSRLETHKFKESRPESRPETSKVQVPRLETHKFKESRPETHKVQEAKPDHEQRFETHKAQEARPELRPETYNVLESRSNSRLETHKVQDSRSDPGPERDQIRAKPLESLNDMTPEESVDGHIQNPFGVRLRKTQGSQRFIAEDEHKQPIQMLKVEPPSVSPHTKQPITPKTSLSNPPIAAKPTILYQPITSAVPNPPISAKPVVARKPEATTGNKAKRASDTKSEPPSWISVAKHKQKIYKQNSSISNKDETEKNTPVSSKGISLNLKPAAPLSHPTPVPPTAQKPSLTCPTPAPTKPVSPSPAGSTPSCPGSASPPASCPGSASPPASPQEELPWMALAKKKAKAWSEMPQIVQ